MTFIEDWKHIWHRLWSVRLAVLSSLCSAIELTMNYIATGQTPLFVVGALVVSLVGAWSRIVKQESLDLNADYLKAP